METKWKCLDTNMKLEVLSLSEVVAHQRDKQEYNMN
jgi:hypothetical protein